jgi:hypothetical protein
VLFLVAAFYAIFECAIVAHVFNSEFGGPPLWFWSLVVVAYSVPFAVGGVQSFLDKFNGILLPLYIAGVIGAVVWTVVDRGYNPNWLDGSGTATVSSPGWVYAFILYMGVWVVMMYTGDMARHAQPRDLKFHRWVTFGPVLTSLMIVVNAAFGIFLATHLVSGAVTETSVIDGMLGLAGLWAVLLIWITQTRINTANFYIASTNLANLTSLVLRRSAPRWFWVLALGVIVYVLMMQDFISKLQAALQYGAIITVAWVGAALAYMAWAKIRGLSPEHIEYRPGRVRAVAWPGVASWALGIAVGVIMLNFGGAVGGTWYAPASFVVSFAIYYGALLIDAKAGAASPRPYDPRDEVDDPWAARIRCHVCTRSYIAQEIDRDPSAGHQAICCECAGQSHEFLSAARAESGGAGTA